MPTAFFIGVASKKAEDKSHTNNTHIPFFSYLIIGATITKHNGGTTHNKQLTPAAKLNNKPITHTTRVLLPQLPGQPLPIDPQAYSRISAAKLNNKQITHTTRIFVTTIDRPTDS